MADLVATLPISDKDSGPADEEPDLFPDDLRSFVTDGPGPGFPTETHTVPVDCLVFADSPRLTGEDTEHVRRLTEVETTLPPILVHRATMRVIDGRHRLRAAVSRGQETIEVQFFDGPESHVFALAVGANVRHGLPLSLADREAAAARIIASHPLWSDRVIAETSGLSARTVAAIRRRGQYSVPLERLGRDGRIRPLDTASGRRIASDIIAQRPTASLREIAREAGISPTTVRDVRLRMERGDNPILSTHHPDPHRAPEHTNGVRAEVRSMPDRGAPPSIGDPDAIVHGLRSDPSLRLTEAGRTFLRWFLPRVTGPRGWDELTGNIPPHCKYTVANLARQCANEWHEFADLMEQQARSTA